MRVRSVSGYGSGMSRRIAVYNQKMMLRCVMRFQLRLASL